MSEARKVLLVDDDPDIIEQLSLMLKADGYDLSVAYSRAEAEELLLMLRPDLAILDVMMETPDAGIVLTHHLQKLHPGTPVILLTSVASVTGLSFRPQSAEMQSWVGAGKVLDKPVRPEQIRQEVHRLLGEDHTETANTHH